MKRTLFFLFILFLLLTACASPTPDPTLTPTQPAPTLTPSPTDTLTPSPTLTPTYDIVFFEKEKREMKEAEIRQNIELFLNEEGIYSDEALKESSFLPNDPGNPEKGLGLIHCLTDSVANMQGVSVGVLPGPDGKFLHVFFGTEDENNQRIVLPVRIMLTKGFEQQVPLIVSLFKGEVFSWTNFRPNDPEAYKLIFDSNEVLDSLEEMVGLSATGQLILSNKNKNLVIDKLVEEGATLDEATDFYNNIIQRHLIDQAKSIFKLTRKVSKNCVRADSSKYSDYKGVVITKDNQLEIDFEDILTAEEYTLFQAFVLREK